MLTTTAAPAALPAGPQYLLGPQGPAGPQGRTGVQGATGSAGPGVPTGGTSGQVLSKSSATNYDTHWTNGVAGANTQVQFNDAGVPGVDANLTWDKATGVFTATGPNGTSLQCDDQNMRIIAQSTHQVYLGDFGNLANHNVLTVDDLLNEITLDTPAGVVSLGKVGGGGPTLRVDVPNVQATLNVDLSFDNPVNVVTPGASVGPCLVDRATARLFRLYVEAGVLAIERAN